MSYIATAITYYLVYCAVMMALTAVVIEAITSAGCKAE